MTVPWQLCGFIPIVMIVSRLFNCVHSFETSIYLDNYNSLSNDLIRTSIYLENLQKTFRQNPELVIKALLAQEHRKFQNQKVFTDQFGRHFVWNSQSGYQLYTGQPGAVPFPVTWISVPGENVPVMSLTDESLVPLRSNPFACVPKSSSIQEDGKPTMSFYEPPTETEPCANSHHSEFGVTATSTMADMLCGLCKWLKSLRCIWEFCTHPEGVYKVKSDLHY